MQSPRVSDPRVLGELGDVFGFADLDQESFQRSITRMHRLMMEGRLEQALLEIDIEIDRFSGNPVFLGLAAHIATRLGRFERAESYWSRLVDEDSDNVGRLSPLGAVLLRLGDYDAAERVLERARDIHPYDTATSFHLLCLHVITERAEQGYALLRAMSAPDLAVMAKWLHDDYDVLIPLVGEDIYSTIAWAILRGGEPHVASARAARPPVSDLLTFSPSGEVIPELFTAPDPENTDASSKEMRARLKRGHALIEQFGRAITAEAWDEAVEIGAGAASPRVGLSATAFRSVLLYARWRAGESDARDALQQLVTDYPDGLHARLRFVVMLMEDEMFAEAVDELREMDATHPSQVLVRLFLACALAEGGKHPEALQILDALEDRVMPFVARWFDANVTYQRAILQGEPYAEWRERQLHPARVTAVRPVGAP